MIKNLMKKK